MKKHWTLYLPEGWRIFRDQVNSLENLESIIKKTEHELCELHTQRLQANWNLTRSVAKQYSEEEIKLAYIEYEKESTLNKEKEVLNEPNT